MQVLRADGSLDREAFAALWPDLRVMGRCSPKDKYTIVQGKRCWAHVLASAVVVREQPWVAFTALMVGKQPMDCLLG